jgi:tetratricopeptide (TPR) repeat protein
MTALDPAKTLTCFYDLKVSPVGFDFVTYMVIVNLHRRMHACDSIHLVIVPNESAGLNIHDQLNPFAADQATWRIFNMILPVAGLIESCAGITVCPDRKYCQFVLDACQGPTYPANYTLENPPDDSWIFPLPLMYGNIGVEIPSLTAPAQALEYAQGWIDTHCQGKKVVSITLREGTHNAIRNSDIQAWSEFIQWLDKDRYFPVILPDIERVFETKRPEFSGTAFFPEGVMNLQVRAAFYQLCYANLLTGAGPGELMRYNGRVRYIQFKTIAPFELSLEPSHATRHGLPEDGQYPFRSPYHKIVLEEETFDLLVKEFSELAAKIDSDPEDAFAFQRLQHPKPINSDHIIEVINRYKAGHQFGRAIKFMALYLERNPEDDIIKGILVDIISEHIFPWVLFDNNIYNSNAELFDSIKEFYRSSVEKYPDNPLYLTGIAMLALAMRDFDEAQSWLTKAHDAVNENKALEARILSNFGWLEFCRQDLDKYLEFSRQAFQAYPSTNLRMQLVLALEHLGQFDEAISHLTKMLDEGADDNTIHRKLGQLYKQIGDYQKSIEHMMIAERS